MRIRERGIGNLPFIAVLVLFVISLVLFFMARDEADTNKAEVSRLRTQAGDDRTKLLNARDAYDAWVDVFDLGDNAVLRAEDSYPDPEVIKDKVRTFLDAEAKKLEKASQAKLQNRQYQVDKNTNEVKVIEGDITTVQLFGTPFAKETITVKQLMGPLERQFAYAAKFMEENNQQFESTYDSNRDKESQAATKLTEIQNTFNTQVSTLTATNEAQKQQISDVAEQNTKLNTDLDSARSESATARAEMEKRARTLGRTIQAQKDYIRNIKDKKAIAEAEDPKDGEVLVANPRKDLVYINLGRRSKVSAGTKFKVWRAGKGNQREDIAVIRVLRVDRTKSEARIIKRLNPRVPVTAGMNISNPFYSPTETLTVYIFGDLRHYPTEVAKRRLARSGVRISPTLDDRVDVIILGEPAVAVGGEEIDTEDEAGMAAAARRIAAERDKRLFEIRDIAASIGAVVVTEDVLRTFIDY